MFPFLFMFDLYKILNFFTSLAIKLDLTATQSFPLLKQLKISLMAERQTENTMSTLLVEQAHSQYCIDFLMAKLVKKKRMNLNSSSFVKILISL